MKDVLIVTTVFLLLAACDTSKKVQIGNPPAPGFDLANSDPKAIEIADQVMLAVGGRQNWDKTLYIKWNFFGKRLLVWDKKKNRVRIEYQDRPTRILLDLDDMTGQVKKAGVMMVNPDSLRYYLDTGKKVWINDSYWLLMPFKLKDSGVTLKYLGQQNNELGIASDVLQLTFQNVGVTPQNKYHVYVNPQTHLVTQWDYYSNATDSLPEISRPWGDYRPYGNIILSSNRGKSGTISSIGVFEALPDSVFTSMSDVNWANIISPPRKKKKK